MFRRFSLQVGAVALPLPHSRHSSTASTTFSSSSTSEDSVMERAAAARCAIHTLWREFADAETSARAARVAALCAAHRLDASTPRAADVSRGLGDAFDRLLLLCLPGGTERLEGLLRLAARNGRPLSTRTVQHLFARAASFAEALAVFYAMRRAHVAMEAETYYAMLYALQRLEEEGWAERFREDAEREGRVSEQAMDFVMRGIHNALLPENKPWLGRVMFDDNDGPATQKGEKEYDALNRTWTQRYKDGVHIPSPE